MVTKQGSQQVYNTLHKCREWLIPNCVVNTIGRVLSIFYIFKGRDLHDDCNSKIVNNQFVWQ